MGWDAAQTASFLQMQFRAQTQSYRLQFPHAVTQIALSDGVVVGRLITKGRDDEMYSWTLRCCPPTPIGAFALI